MNLQNITALHRASVGLVFSKWGIKAPVTPETVASAVVVYKEPFINDVQRAVDAHFAYDSNEGERTKGQKAAETLRNILNMAAGAFGAYQAGKQLGISNTTQPAANKPKPDDMDKKNMKTFIIGIAAVLVAVLLFVAVTRMKDKTAK